MTRASPARRRRPAVGCARRGARGRRGGRRVRVFPGLVRASGSAAARRAGGGLDGHLARDARGQLGGRAGVGRPRVLGGVRPGRRTRRTWKLVTPPGVADNGGLVASADGASSLTVAVRPSQNLAFSPLAATANGGASWSDRRADQRGRGRLPRRARRLRRQARRAARATGPSTPAPTPGRPGRRSPSQAPSPPPPPPRDAAARSESPRVSFGPTGTDVLAGGTCGTSGTTAMFSYSAGHGVAAGEPAGVRASSCGSTDASALVLGKSGLTALWRRRLAPAYRAAAACDLRPPPRRCRSPAPSPRPARWPRRPRTPRPGHGCSFPADAPRRSAGRPPRAARCGGGGCCRRCPRTPRSLASGPDGAVDALAVSGGDADSVAARHRGDVWSKSRRSAVPLQYGSSS